jgi:general secretion pathway protein D
VNIEAKFTEISQSDSKALGFSWFLGNTLMNKGAIGLQGGTAPSFQGAPTTANPTGGFPGLPPNFDPNNPAGTALPPSSSDQFLSRGLGNVVGTDRRAIPAVATITGILTDPQFRMVIHALEQRAGVDVLSAPNVTTLSGRQAKIDVTEVRTIVSNQGFNQAAGGGGAGLGGAVPQLGATTGGAVAAASQFGTQPVPLGPSLDVVPYVAADGYSIQMTIIPTLVEFLGYDDPGQFIPQAQSAAGNTLGTPLVAVLPLPKFRVRQVITSANVWDGQTIVLGGLIAEDVAKIKDKIPVLGDLPLLGRFFRSESMATTKKNLVIFVTPTIVDPAGNRVHTDDNLPYDPNATPTPAPNYQILP